MRLQVRWLGATLKPAMLWPKLLLGLSTGSSLNLTGLKLSSTPEEQAQAGTDGLPRASSEDILPTPPYSAEGDWGVWALMALSCQRTSVSQAGPPFSPALNVLTHLQPPTCHSIT